MAVRQVHNCPKLSLPLKANDQTLSILFSASEGYQKTTSRRPRFGKARRADKLRDLNALLREWANWRRAHGRGSGSDCRRRPGGARRLDPAVAAGHPFFAGVSMIVPSGP